MPLSRRDPKVQGEQAECAFLLQATRRGLIVSKPWGDTARYDFVVDNGSRLLRVQIKSVSVTQDGSYHISTGSGHSSKTAYTLRDIDLLAAYVIPEDAWYLIPIHAFTPRKTIHLCPHRPESRRNFEEYREAWEVINSRQS